jgi:hypothetical protein
MPAKNNRRARESQPPRDEIVRLKARSVKVSRPTLGRPVLKQIHMLQAVSLDSDANKRKRKPPASGKHDGRPPIFDEPTIATTRAQLRAALVKDRRLHSKVNAFRHVVTLLKRQGIPFDEKKNEKTIRRCFVNPVLDGE